jgi:hypothetical protein
MISAGECGCYAADADEAHTMLDPSYEGASCASVKVSTIRLAAQR